MRGNTRYICYAFVAFAMAGCTSMEMEKATQAFAMGLAGGAAIHSYGASQVVQPVYYQPVAQQPGGSWHLVRTSTVGQMRYCVYSNNAVHTTSLHLSCPAYTF